MQKITSEEFYTRFEDILVEHNIEFSLLLNTRGQRSREHVLLKLAEFDELLNYLPQSTGVLIFNHESDILEAFFLSRNHWDYSRTEISAKRLNHTTNAIRSILGVDTLSDMRSRSTVQRGERKVSARKPAYSLSEAITSLSKQLFPVDLGKSLDDIDCLIIIPVLNLGTIPFGLLPIPQTNKLIIEQTTISIAPSLYDFYIGAKRVIEREEQLNTLNNPLIIGNPTYGPNSDLIQLPGAEQEANEVADLLGSKALIGAHATLQAVRERSQNAEILYFATHGESDSDNPLDGGKLFLANAESWTAREIQSLDLKNTHLTVLSACQTGLGATHEAGIIGLARSFILAGCPHVLMSLWNVDDQATMELMSHFISQLISKNGQRVYPAGALRKAMLDVRKKHPDQAKWASFIHFGVPG